tara:strand:+ start:589 stop:1197 length:609 start_codon:yes stop_codon:yes gene_type:complete
MPLNLSNPSDGGGGKFLDKLRFNAQGGVFYTGTKENEKRFSSGFTAVFDMAGMETGWSRYNGRYKEFRADPNVEEKSAKPEITDGDAENKWKRGFRVAVYSGEAFGGTVEFMHDAITVCQQFSALYDAYEKYIKDIDEPNALLPVVKVEGDPIKAGEYYAPIWSIKKFVKRPDAMQPLPQEDSKPAAPAPAAGEDVPTDDEF